MRTHKARSSAVAAAAFALIAGTACAHWAMPTDAPVDRLVQNLGKYAEEHPKEAGAWYRLGRVHSLAYVKKWRSVQVFERDKSKPSDPAPDWMQNRWDDKKIDKPYTEQELREHLSEAIRCFNKAIELDAAEPEYFHSLAYILEQGAGDAASITQIAHPSALADDHWSAQEGNEAAQSLVKNPSDTKKAMEIVTGHRGDLGFDYDYLNGEARTALLQALFDTKGKSAELTKAVAALVAADWKEQACELHFRAFALAQPGDTKLARKPLRGVQSLLTHESATSYIAAVKVRGERPSDKVRLELAQAAIKSLEALPENNAITPIIMPLDVDRGMDSLLDPGSRCRFDLDGTGRGQEWPWLRPNTGVLAWNPSGDGKIDSGRQLFGSVTWWIFFDDGYQALDALDDNRDGRLSGNELRGLVIWTDRNGNGVSDPCEVVPATALGVKSISCRSTSLSGGCAAAYDGLECADGRVLPTYDWVTEPVQRPRLTGTLPLLAGAVALASPVMFAARRKNRPRSQN